ncbi:hypothetical protein ANS017_25910 [Paraclostridium bifermentans]|nr:hypothetical protein ANS014_17820 [Paraclostridium bifermentans]GKZ06193.1 hypothetical protein ANS015_10760 [Paraclostridium bifermentans]GKZ11207.1 hypothetical protein ANS017_25910 [Paraclostridium bifermentans]
MFWKINPKPTGIAMYGVLRPNVSAHATALLSIFNLFISDNNDGINIGINAI